MVDNIRQILAVGENVVVEFKRCGNGIKFGTYENILYGKADVPINVPINGALNERVLEAIAQSPGINRTQLANRLKVDVKTIGRTIAMLSGSVEHRGSKKTGGYYVRN
jgi:predicted HTH transcriptional regulator